MLVAAGGNVDLQTGSYRGNVTALMLAAAQGHLELVKALVELKASPDKKGWFVTWLKFSYFFTSCTCLVVFRYNIMSANVPRQVSKNLWSYRTLF